MSPVSTVSAASRQGEVAPLPPGAPLLPASPTRVRVLAGFGHVLVSGLVDPADVGLGTGNVSLRVGVHRPAGAQQALAARRSLLADAGLALEQAVFAEQIHGAGVARVARGDMGRGSVRPADAVADADALVTTEHGLGLVVLAADCVPLALVAAGGVASVHVGRQGLYLGIVPAAVRALAAASGGDPEHISAVVGPAIGGCCYEVPAGMAAEVASSVPQAAARTSWGTPALDLRAGVDAQLRASGVTGVARVGGCTRCGPGWFSHRASQSAARPVGRHALVVTRQAVTQSQAG